jgi:hypothetical protein
MTVHHAERGAALLRVDLRLCYDKAPLERAFAGGR